MKRVEADKLFNEDKITKETTSFFYKRNLNDLIDGRVSYQHKEKNLQMMNEEKGKLKKNDFVHKEE